MFNQKKNQLLTFGQANNRVRLTEVHSESSLALINESRKLSISLGVVYNQKWSDPYELCNQLLQCNLSLKQAVVKKHGENPFLCF